jgi:hypothetical protein
MLPRKYQDPLCKGHDELEASKELRADIDLESPQYANGLDPANSRSVRKLLSCPDSRPPGPSQIATRAAL